MCIHVLGAGSIGLLFSSYLKKIGLKVSLLVRPETLSQITAADLAQNLHESPTVPINVLSLDGSKQAYNVNFETFNTPGPIKNLLITTKTYDTITAITPLLPRLDPHPTIILLQNGNLKVHKELSTFFGSRFHPNYIFGITTHGALRSKADRFTVTHTGIGNAIFGPAVTLNESKSLSRHGDIDLVLDQLSSLSELNVSIERDWKKLHSALMLKLAVNAIINPLTALMNCKNGFINDVSLRPLINQLVDEIALLFGHCISDQDPQLVVSIAHLVREVADVTKENRSSMLEDVANGRKIEIEYITGYLLELGAEHSVSMQNNRMVYNLLKAKFAQREV
ncbi:2-dehydropantoate 2-reductase (Ketopantoate reductase) (KPA reductase) (KPR) [Nowakowskiella sp. JEL0407]|nr:2-dehydropantoate 2-reductase (Ketopantoate reductase) (KPA reductase) (KPR) [Nowakowskiella sp. JEL0407]